MKTTERQKAYLMRKQGKSLDEIAKALKVSKASVSTWVRHIKLTQQQLGRLNERGHSVGAIEKRRLKRIANTEKKRSEIIHTAIKDVAKLTKRELWLIGVALYWGEGGKTFHGSARIANSDPEIIKVMMRFFKEVCEVPDTKFRGHIHTFSHLNQTEAETYWSNVSGIPRKQFFKTYTKSSKTGLQKRDSLPYGTFQIYVCNTELYLKLMGWIQGLGLNINNR